MAASPSGLLSRQNSEFAWMTISQAPRSSGERLCDRMASASSSHQQSQIPQGLDGMQPFLTPAHWPTRY
jgi:hypothetical protein